MKYKNIKGSKDFLPEYHKYLTFLKKVYRHEFRKNGFKRISTPMIETKDFIEKTGAIKNSIIDNVDIDIRQKPYIGIIKAYLNYNLSEEIQPIYFYFMESFLKKIGDDIEEKILIGTEIIGEDDPILDAIQIYINYKVLNDIGLSDKFVIKINSIGIEKEKNKFKEELINFYDNKRNILTKQSEKLIDINPLLILQSNDEDEKILNQNAPKVAQKFLKKDSKLHYQKFKEYLELLKIPFIEDNNLVSEDQNHVKTIWSFEDLNGEIITNGYRHNSVTKNIGEIKEIPATGFWTDTEKVIEMLMQSNLELKNKDKIDLFFVQLGDEAKKVVLPISIKAREAGINTVISLGTPSMKEQMLKAQKSEAKFVVMVGVMEAKNGVFQVRNQVNGSQCEVKKDELIDYIIGKIGKENLDFYSPIDDLTNKRA
ncbi:hypothetical protein D8B46_06785 [Candidatus Gracilibacteria bacterium]|nr:hypothetical protein [Candidatus Gracilibacteria bacterium]RKW21781.1 MAG: hypothetical protein D8B46_06785 [Candidatus Gracilibacteria bacterium]